MILFAKTQNGKILKVSAENEMTISELKIRLTSEYCGILGAVSTYGLYSRGQKLQESKTISSLSLESQQLLHIISHALPHESEQHCVPSAVAREEPANLSGNHHAGSAIQHLLLQRSMRDVNRATSDRSSHEADALVQVLQDVESIMSSVHGILSQPAVQHVFKDDGSSRAWAEQVKVTLEKIEGSQALREVARDARLSMIADKMNAWEDQRGNDATDLSKLMRNVEDVLSSVYVLLSQEAERLSALENQRHRNDLELHKVMQSVEEITSSVHVLLSQESNSVQALKNQRHRNDLELHKVMKSVEEIMSSLHVLLSQESNSVQALKKRVTELEETFSHASVKGAVDGLAAKLEALQQARQDDLRRHASKLCYTYPKEWRCHRRMTCFAYIAYMHLFLDCLCMCICFRYHAHVRRYTQTHLHKCTQIHETHMHTHRNRRHKRSTARDKCIARPRTVHRGNKCTRKVHSSSHAHGHGEVAKRSRVSHARQTDRLAATI
jgi:hypothetical protein